MKNQIISLEEKNRKVFCLTDDQIITSTKRHKSIDALVAATKKSGLMETVQTIPLTAVKEIGFNEKDETFTIHYQKGAKAKKEHIQLAQLSLREPLVGELAALKNFSKEVTEESKTKPLLLNLLGVIAIPLFTWVFRDMAIDAQNGIAYEASGRRSGLKSLLADFVEMIGPTGVLIIGLLGLGYMVYRTYNRFQNPAAEIIYQ